MTAGFQKTRAWLLDHPALAAGLSIASLFFYALQLWQFTHTQYSVLDEGLYLFKGWLFATGKYTPFQSYGPWTNQMPLSFLIPGWMELLLGPGLRTGRTLALLLGLLTFLALWLTARRLSGRWTAALLAAAIALNPAAGRMVSMAASQGLVACLLAWTLFFSLGADRKNGQLALAGLLAGAAVMTRVNLLPLLPLLVLYVFWMHGWKSALWALAGELLVFGGMHLLYWPNILQVWARWFPLAALKPWAPPPNTPTWNPDNPLGFRVASFFLAFRYHFAALTGVLATWLFWPKADPKVFFANQAQNLRRIPAFHSVLIGRETFRVLFKSFQTNAHFKTAIFLSALFLVFFALHAWAALGNEYCVFCFSTYTSFYGGVGLLLVAATLPAWRLDLPAWRTMLGALGMLGLLVGMAYSAEGTVESLFGNGFYKSLLTSPAPGFAGAQFWQIAANKFQMEYRDVFDAFHVGFPVALAAAFGLGLLAVGKMLNGTKNSAASAGVLLFLLLGTLFSPSPLLAGEYNSYDCASDVIPDYERVAAQLRKVIPPGASVYWDGYSPVSLLALPDAKIYPAQLHGTYSFRVSDDDDALLKYGWWNRSLAEKWLGQADFALVEERNLPPDDWLAQALENDYQEVAVTGAQAACRPDSFFHVYRRK